MTKKVKRRRSIFAVIAMLFIVIGQILTFYRPVYALGLQFQLYDGKNPNGSGSSASVAHYTKDLGAKKNCIHCTYYHYDSNEGGKLKKTDVWYVPTSGADVKDTTFSGTIASVIYNDITANGTLKKDSKKGVIDKVVVNGFTNKNGKKYNGVTFLGYGYSDKDKSKAKKAAAGTSGFVYVNDLAKANYTIHDPTATESEKNEAKSTIDKNGKAVSDLTSQTETNSGYGENLTDGSDEQTQSYIGKVVAWILKKIFGIFSGFNAGIINFCIGNIEGNMRVDPPNNFFPLFSGITGGNISDSTFNLGFKIIGFVVLTLDALVGLYLCMLVDDSVDTPISIFYRIVFACFFITMNRPILNLVNQLFFGTDSKQGMTSLFTSSSADTADVSKAVKALFDPGEDNILQKQIGDTFSGLDDDLAYIAVQLLLIGATLVMVINILKLMLEIMERWILLNLYYCFAPVVAGFTASKTTSNAFVKFIEGYLSQSFIMVLNIWFVGIFRQILLNIGDNLEAMQNVTAQGNTTGWSVVLFLALLIGILQACSRVDEYLSDMGFTVARTGHQLGAAMFGGFSMATGAMLAAPGKIRKVKNNIANDKADIQRARASWASHAESGGPGGVEGMRRQAANMFHDRNFANKVRKNGGVITNGMLQNYMHNGYGRSNFQSLKQAMDNGALPKNTTMTSDAALSMLKNSAGEMAKKSGITFTDASYDTRNSIGTWRGRNANGDLVTGTFSTSAKGIKNGFNVAPPGEAPLFMNADKGLIGGKFAATNDGKETLAQMRDGTSMLENGEESGIAPDHRISNGMVVGAMEAAGAAPQMVMFDDPATPELASEPRYWAPIEGGEDYPVMSDDDKAAWVGQNADHFYVSQVGDGDDSDAVALSMDQIDPDGNFISNSDPRDDIAVLSHSGNESDQIGMDEYNQEVYAVPGAADYDALSEPAANSVPLAQSEYYGDQEPVPVDAEPSPESISAGAESIPAMNSSPSAESNLGANIASGQNSQSGINQIPNQANAEVFGGAGAENPEMIGANASPQDMEGIADESKMQTITAGGRGDLSSGHYSNMKIPSGTGENEEAGVQAEIGENVAKVSPISTMPVKNMPVESSQADLGTNANTQAITLNHDSAANAERYTSYRAQDEIASSQPDESHQNVQSLGGHNSSGQESTYTEKSREEVIASREEKRAENFLRNAYPVESALAGDRIDGKFAKDSIKPIDFNGYKAMYVANPNNKSGKVFIPADQVTSQWELSMKTGSRPTQQQITDEDGKKSTYWVISNVKGGIPSDDSKSKKKS